MTNDPHLFPSIGTAVNLAANLLDETASNNDGAEQDRPVEEVESLCMKCGEQGTTRLLLTSIPFFRQVVLMSFHCEHCGTTNNEIQSAGTVRRTSLSKIDLIPSTMFSTFQRKELSIPYTYFLAQT
jgi:zinc finger protein